MKHQLNEIQRMQQLAGINEIKVINPADKRYYLNPFWDNWIDQHYDDIRYEFGEDTADAIWMFKMASPDNKTLSENDVKFLFKEEPELWDSDVDGFISFLFQYGIITTK